MTFFRNFISTFAAAAALAMLAACGSDDPVAPIENGSGSAVLEGTLTANRQLSADTVYTLRGFVKVASGATLMVPAGTRIVGDTLVPGSALFILRGARIDAQGTAAAPIVFTSARAPGNRSPGDFGGLILIGNATVNRQNVIIEGSDANVPNGGPPGITYTGGTSDNDNSGTLRYVRVEFAGFGVAQDAELNSFTFGAVGSGTTLEYLQAVAGLDDHFEYFGGTVNGRYFVSYESADDHFDTSEGYRGRNQFMIGLQTTVLQPRPGTGSLSSDPQGMEMDGCAGTGCTDLQNSAPYNMPMYANFTLIGPGAGVLPATGGVGMVQRRGTGGTYVNGIIGRWPTAISVRDATTDQRRQADSLLLRNILLVQNANNLDPSGSNFTQPEKFANAALDSVAGSAGAQFLALPPAGATPTTATLDWTPAPGSAAATGGMNTFSGLIAARAGTFIVPTSFRGAAAPNGPKWWAGWTVYYRN